MWTGAAARLNPPDPRCSFADPPGALRLPALRPAARGPGPGRRVRTALDFPATRRNPWPSRPGSIVAHRWPPLPRYPASAWAAPLLEASVQVSAVAAERPPPGTSAPGQSHVPVRPGAACCSGWGTDLTWQDRTRPPSPRRPGERGMRNGNVPRRSAHPLEVFPRVQ
jgi:hypothetical protein